MAVKIFLEILQVCFQFTRKLIMQLLKSILKSCIWALAFYHVGTSIVWRCHYLFRANSAYLIFKRRKSSLHITGEVFPLTRRAIDRRQPRLVQVHVILQLSGQSRVLLGQPLLDFHQSSHVRLRRLWCLGLFVDKFEQHYICEQLSGSWCRAFPRCYCPFPLLSRKKSEPGYAPPSAARVR